MVPLDKVLASSYRLSVVTLSLSAAVWPQFATQVFGGGAGSLRYIGSHVISKKLRSHLLAFGRGQYGRLPLATAGLLLLCVVMFLFALEFYCFYIKVRSLDFFYYTAWCYSQFSVFP